VRVVNDGEQGLRILELENFDLVLLDLALPGQSGLELLPLIKERQPELPVIMITAYGTVDNVVEAVRAGAENFVQKPWDNEKLLADIRSAVARHRAEEENLQLKRALKQRYNFANIVGKSESCSRFSTSWPRSRPAAPRSLSRARAAPARSSSPRPSTPTRPVATSRSSPSTPAPCLGAA